MEDNARQKGLEIFAEIFGEDMAQGLKAHMESDTAFGAMQSQWTVEFPFGSVWAREGLARKARSCAVIGMLIGLRAHDELVCHVKMGIRNGLSRRELEEIFYTAIPYAGFPAAQHAKKAMLQAFAEIDAETQAV